MILCNFKDISNHLVPFLGLSVITVFYIFNDIFEGSRRECGAMEMIESCEIFYGIIGVGSCVQNLQDLFRCQVGLELLREKSCWVEIASIFLSHGANYKYMDLLRWFTLAYYLVVLMFKKIKKVPKCRRGLFRYWQKITPFPRG